LFISKIDDNFLKMKILILGCGTSCGVPMIGCDCPVCTSKNPRNTRTRASILIGNGDKNILIDTSPDLRMQALRHRIKRIDAVLYTHTHADHLLGIDDLRGFNFIQYEPIPIYGNKKTIAGIKRTFPYIFSDGPSLSTKPVIDVHIINGRFETCGLKVTPVKVFHGADPILGFRMGSFAYITDCNRIPGESMKKLAGLKVLILDALREVEHPTHFTISEAVSVSRELGVERTILTHMCHRVDYEKIGGSLPKGVELAFDGMEIEA
jgi:phosphoribosyl 1,2-cyclic phosphate phosphodiesterase